MNSNTEFQTSSTAQRVELEKVGRLPEQSKKDYFLNRLNGTLVEVEAKLRKGCNQADDFDDLTQLKTAIAAAMTVLNACTQSDVELLGE